MPSLSGPCLQFSSRNSIFVQICQPTLSRNALCLWASDLFPRPAIFFFLYSMLTSPEIEVGGAAQESFFGHTGLLSLPRRHFGGQSPGVQGTGPPLAVVVVVIITAHRRGEWQV